MHSIHTMFYLWLTIDWTGSHVPCMVATDILVNRECPCQHIVWNYSGSARSILVILVEPFPASWSQERMKSDVANVKDTLTILTRALCSGCSMGTTGTLFMITCIQYMQTLAVCVDATKCWKGKNLCTSVPVWSQRTDGTDVAQMSSLFFCKFLVPPGHCPCHCHILPCRHGTFPGHVAVIFCDSWFWNLSLQNRCMVSSSQRHGSGPCGVMNHDVIWCF
jgi:hypothetical protein